MIDCIVLFGRARLGPCDGLYGIGPPWPIITQEWESRAGSERESVA